jgi:hypothetical protein
MTKNANDFGVTTPILTIQSKIITAITTRKNKIKRRLTTSNCLFLYRELIHTSTGESLTCELAPDFRLFVLVKVSE